MRILRYRSLLGSRFDSLEHTIQPFIDLNYPRAQIGIDEANYPSFFQLVDAVRKQAFSLVFIDIEEQVGFSHYYGWVSRCLKETGVQVVNVYYDTEEVFKEHLTEHYRGQAHEQEVTDASDFVAFFPAMSADISYSSLRRELESTEGRGQQLDRVRNTLHHLQNQNPYSSGRQPFIQEDLRLEWFARLRAVDATERLERRKHEQLFRLAPCMSGVLIDDGSSVDSEKRNIQELEWAEARIVSQLGFEKVVDGQCVSYVRDCDGYRVYADIRMKPRITFYVYKVPKEAKAKAESSKRFSLQDRLTNKLGAKWNSEFNAVVR